MIKLIKLLKKIALFNLAGLKYRFYTRKSFIPLIKLLPGPDRRIIEGKFKDTPCYYKTGLLNTLIKFRPKICLEIGTYYGGTTKIFEYYFSKYEPQGILITADIRKYTNFSGNKVKQAIICPHVYNSSDFHDVSEEQMLPDFDKHINDSVEANCEILHKGLRDIEAESFDFCFIDGDHQKISFLGDLEIAKRLSKPPHYILLDDTKEELHECAFVYQHELIEKVNHFDFNDWPIFIGMSLVWY